MSDSMTTRRDATGTKPRPNAGLRPRIRRSFATLLATAALSACDDPSLNGLDSQAAAAPGRQARGGFEVWLLDQSDTPGLSHGGTLYIWEGSDLMGHNAGDAQPIDRVDLSSLAAGACAATGKNPVRPHMILFNQEHTHAIVSFVASGHVVIFDAQTRAPVGCFLTTVGDRGAQQAHAAFAAPDGSYIVVANQNGKRLERINTDFATNTFVHDLGATLDLATCTTPNGFACQDPDLRPDNAPICPIIEPGSRYGFVTLRGGGMFVVDARRTNPQIRIVGEYDRATVKGNGCGGTPANGSMYINSGGSPTAVPVDHPHKFGFDVYRFPMDGYDSSNGPNAPAPALLFSKGGMTDSHGMAPTRGDEYVWVLDRHGDVAEVLSTSTGQRVNTVQLAGPLSDNPAPDLIDVAPSGNRMFAALRGPTPLSGDPHNATGSTPGLGVIQLTHNGRSGQMIGVIRISNIIDGAEKADAHGIRVRVRKGQ
jgi:hypothetical protein